MNKILAAVLVVMAIGIIQIVNLDMDSVVYKTPMTKTVCGCQEVYLVSPMLKPEECGDVLKSTYETILVQEGCSK